MLYTLLQDLDSYLRAHKPERMNKVEELAQYLMNNHVMGSTVKTDLDQLKKDLESQEVQVCP